jgi:hypothetical protein
MAKIIKLENEEFVKCSAKGCNVLSIASPETRLFYFCYIHPKNMKEIKRKVYHNKSLKNGYLK